MDVIYAAPESSKAPLLIGKQNSAPLFARMIMVGCKVIFSV